MSEATPPKLTLEQWAALDAAACKGPWLVEKHGNAYWLLGEFITAAQDHAFRGEIGGTFDSEGEKNAQFMAASKGAPTRLLAALRGLRADWAAYRQRLDAIGNHGQAIVLEGCQQELGHLIKTLDLAAPPQERQQ